MVKVFTLFQSTVHAFRQHMWQEKKKKDTFLGNLLFKCLCKCDTMTVIHQITPFCQSRFLFWVNKHITGIYCKGVRIANIQTYSIHSTEANCHTAHHVHSVVTFTVQQPAFSFSAANTSVLPKDKIQLTSLIL